MGLIAFLKKKFGKHPKEEIKEEQSEQTSLGEPEESSSAPTIEEVKTEESVLNEPETEVTTGVEEEPETVDVQEEVKQPTSEPVNEAVSVQTEVEKPESNKPEVKQAEEPIKKQVEEVKTEEKEEKKEEEIVNKYVAGLDKSRIGFTERLNKLASSHKEINQEYFDSLEEILFEADVGYDVIMDLIKEVVRQSKADGITDPEALNDLLIDKMFLSYANEGKSFSTDLSFVSDGPTICLMCGVNGSGKTTTIAKLAYKYKNRGKKVLLVAGDTFRAGAVEQLEIWANRIGVDILSRPNADPASLCYDSLKKAIEDKYDLVFIDTAGRLQNKKALMDELSKMVRVIKKVIPDAPHEALLVIDANTGQNGIDQASVFMESAPLTGIVVTKMDGTSKGGIILAIRRRLGVPVRFIGLGEKMDDLEEFDLEKYLYGLLVGREE